MRKYLLAIVGSGKVNCCHHNKGMLGSEAGFISVNLLDCVCLNKIVSENILKGDCFECCIENRQFLKRPWDDKLRLALFLCPAYIEGFRVVQQITKIISAITGKHLYPQILAKGYSQEEIDQVLYLINHNEKAILSFVMKHLYRR